jgi:hypothetical protein
MSFFGGASSSSSATVIPASTEKDIEVADPPTDSISSISFSSAADYLAVGSWDNNVCMDIILFDSLLMCSHIGPHLRGWSKWADTRKGDVLTPRARAECLLEQGAFFSLICCDLAEFDFRRETKCCPGVPTMQHACLTSPQGNHSKWLNTMPL